MTFATYAFVFLLAMMLGVELIRRVPSQLHTPLMSGSNAISGIALIGAITLISIPGPRDPIATTIATAAITFAAINVVGGYLVTDRMLKMFGGKKPTAGNGGDA